ncbi:MAG: putative Ig domain-containing protein, partial [Methylococcales bacterium]
AAQMLPLTDIDDAGRVNPFPLFRIEAKDAGSNASTTATDIVVNAGRDLHCRECHLKGAIGANPDAPKSIRRAIDYYEADGDSIFDQEYAAIRNITNLHQAGASCGDNLFLQMQNGNANGHDTGNITAYSDGPTNCNSSSCHTTAISRTPYKQSLRMTSDGQSMGSMGRPLSEDMHRYHGQLQYQDAGKKDVVRTDDARLKNRAKAFDPDQNWDSKTSSMPNSLFPVKDANGKILPMEENCLKCHSGMREQCYRDRMYTAGVTCYQCHGDMLAVGNSFKKSRPGADGNSYRQPWLDEPDCASCHTGNANRGKTGANGFFSGGVMRTAFDEADRSATFRQADAFNPDQIRFAVPVTDMNIGDIFYTPTGGLQPFTTKTPLFRVGKDNHGQVACGACHGAAHAIWPNRDPNANDNITALQLQGHSGPIAECSVCHSADSFAKFEDLDEGVKAADAKVGILGGPHNMHPVNDINWWKAAAGDSVDSTPTQPQRKGVIKGGWHNDYAKIAGRAGEDQCAACHGNDHLGTRLSKTPVDREFINEKGKKVKVKAGTPIGCNLCHTIAKSCTASPSGADCGKTSDRVAASTNLAPVITSTAPSQVLVGEDYRYELKANDPEGSQLSFQLVRNNLGVIDSSYLDTLTGVLRVPAEKIAELSSYYDPAYQAFLFDYQLLVRDNLGAQTAQSVKVALACPTGLIWDVGTYSCAKVAITSRSPVNGVTAEHEYGYQVIAKQSNGDPLTYSLSEQPEGMIINADSGLIYWMPPAKPTDSVSFTITASNARGDSATQQVSLTACSAPMHWDESTGSCQGPVNIISTSSVYGVTAGNPYKYQVRANQQDNLPLTYSLTNAPAGMTVDNKTGLINWLAQASVTGPISFTIKASDKAYTAQQEVSLTVCAAPELWDGGSACISPIQFTSTPTWGVDVGQPYSYQVTATHAKGLPLTYSLADFPSTSDQPMPPKPAGMTIDPQSGLISWIAKIQPAENGGYAYFAVIATDSNGYSTPQTVQALICASGTNFSEALGYCRGDVRIASTQPVFGLDVGQTFTYQVTATDEKPASLPITYSLSGFSPESLAMTIEADTGLITWVAATELGGQQISFTVTATDSQGQQEQQTSNLYVCAPPQHYIHSPETQGCQ